MFHTIYQENKQSILRLCSYYVHDKDLCNDLFQEVMWNLWKNLEQFKGQSKITTWIYRLTVNTSLTFISKNNRYNKKLQNVATESACDYWFETQDPTLENNCKKLYEIIDQLAENEKAIVSLYLENVPSAEIGEILGLSEVNVRVKLHRLKAKIKTSWEEKYGS